MADRSTRDQTNSKIEFCLARKEFGNVYGEKVSKTDYDAFDGVTDTRIERKREGEGEGGEGKKENQE